MVRLVVGSIPHVEPIELFLVPVSPTEQRSLDVGIKHLLLLIEKSSSCSE